MVEIIEEITLEDELKDILDRNTALNFRIRQGEAAKDELEKKIVRVENMINQLSAEEKFVIKIYYMEEDVQN